MHRQPGPLGQGPGLLCTIKFEWQVEAVCGGPEANISLHVLPTQTHHILGAHPAALAGPAKTTDDIFEFLCHLITLLDGN